MRIFSLFLYRIELNWIDGTLFGQISHRPVDFYDSIADINQALVDDGLVDKEKIGGSNYYWSFPAKKDRLQQIQYEKTLANIAVLEQELMDAKTALINAQRGREDEDDDDAAAGNDENATTDEKQGGHEEGAMDLEETKKNSSVDAGTNDKTNAEPTSKKPKIMSRQDKLQRLRDIEQEKNRIMAELETLKENDPLAIANLEKELQLVQQAAFRWTDNIYNCQSYLIKKRNMTKKETYKLLGITDSFDCTFCRYISKICSDNSYGPTSLPAHSILTLHPHIFLSYILGPLDRSRR